MFSSPQASDDEPVLVANIDGGARGNPGPAGYGVVLQDASGAKIDSLHEYLGAQTNNFAEYSGLVAALEYALKNGYSSLKVRSDSELLVKQIKGEYKVRSEALFDIYREAKDLIRKLDSFHIQHVYREQNREADRLANLAMDQGTGKRTAAPQQSSDAKEVTGIVTGGVVHFLEGSLPEGAKVVVRLKR
ncbi:MAG: ribonuclease HI family protein [Terriglobia bacterium]|jgi:ribonuclease HI|nr:ribonuclease HI family protein [Terriglobia bacterium]